MILYIFFLLYSIVVLILLYAILFGSCSFNKKSYLNALYIFVFERIPKYAFNFFQKILPNKNGNNEIEVYKLEKSKKDSLLVFISYYLVYLFFTSVFLVNVYPFIPEFMSNGKFWQFSVYGVLPGPFLVFIIIQLVDPGIITEENVNYYLEKYPYDNVLYKPKKCRRLGIQAVARSRFCPVTKKRIAKYDHYSMWVIRPIGERTIRLYVLFLAMNSSVTVFFFILTLWYIKYVIFVASEDVVWMESPIDNLMIMVTIVLREIPVVAGLDIALCIIGADLIASLIKELYRVSQNVTYVEEEMYQKEAEKGNKIVNIYDKGFIGNWVEVLFPRDEF